MQLLPTLDNILYNVQRQGKISFYVRALEYTKHLLTYALDDFRKINGPTDMNPSC